MQATQSRWERISRRGRTSYLSSTALVMLAVVAYISMNELNRLIGESLSHSGRVHALTDVIGVTAWEGVEAWADWTEAAFSPARLIITHTVFDLVFIACYGILGFRLISLARIRPLPPRFPQAQEEEAARRSTRLSSWLLTALIAIDLFENAILMVLAARLLLDGDLTWWLVTLPYVLAGAAFAKWCVTAVLLLNVLLGSAVGSVVRRFLADAAFALYAQRLGVIFVVAICVFSLVTANGVIEQVPDVYRGWLQRPTERDSGIPQLDFLAIVLSFFAFAVSGLGLFALGRERARHYASSATFVRGGTGVDTRAPASPWPWLTAAAALLVAAFMVELLGGGGLLHFPTLIAVLLILAVIPWVSVCIRGKVPIPFTVQPLDQSERADSVRKAGDLLVAVWIAIAALAPFKSLLAPLFLTSTLRGTDSAFRESFAFLLVLVLAFGVAAVALPVLFRAILAHASSAPVGTESPAPRRLDMPRKYAHAVSSRTVLSKDDSDRGRKLCIGALLCIVPIMGLLLIMPAQLGPVLGPVTVLILLAGGWAVLVGVLTIYLGRSRPLEVFQLLRLRATPVVTLLVVVPLVLAFVNVPAELHAVRVSDSQVVPERVNLRIALREWYENRGDCTTKVTGNGGDSISVVPLLLVAAEGGGIRAATWTVDVMRQLPQDSDCAAGAALLSSGASGGSIGLATFREEGNIDSSATMSTEPFGGPAPLASTIAGLLLGDLLASATGIRVPSSAPVAAPRTDAGSPARTFRFGEWRWHDRAALQELMWEAAAPQFAQPFDATAQAPTGYLILNSTDSVSNCKVIISQLDLMPAANSGSKPTCNGPDAELSNIVDLEDYIGDCIYRMNWSTAATLSARFPFVSPGARLSNSTLPGCESFEDMQLVDGGITDNSALGTISDLAPQLVEHITEINSDASGSAAAPFIVPLVIFVSNESGFDVTAVEATTQPDVVVPLFAIQDAPGAQITPAAWLTRLSDDFASVCDPGFNKCTSAVTGIRKLVSEGTAVVAPATSPAVSVPLGWSLSDFTRAQLRREAEVQSSCGLDVLSQPLETFTALDQVPGHEVLGEWVQSIGQLRKVEAACGADKDYARLGDVLDLFAD